MYYMVIILQPSPCNFACNKTRERLQLQTFVLNSKYIYLIVAKMQAKLGNVVCTSIIFYATILPVIYVSYCFTKLIS